MIMVMLAKGSVYGDSGSPPPAIQNTHAHTHTHISIYSLISQLKSKFHLGSNRLHTILYYTTPYSTKAVIMLRMHIDIECLNISMWMKSTGKLKLNQVPWTQVYHRPITDHSNAIERWLPYIIIGICLNTHKNTYIYTHYTHIHCL